MEEEKRDIIHHLSNLFHLHLALPPYYLLFFHLPLPFSFFITNLLSLSSVPSPTPNSTSFVYSHSSRPSFLSALVSTYFLPPALGVLEETAFVGLLLSPVLGFRCFLTGSSTAMEELSGSGTQIHGSSGAVRKKRSRTFRRRPELLSHSETQDDPLSSAPPSEDASKGSSDENNGGSSSSKRKEFNLNECVVRVSSAASGDSENSRRKTQRHDGDFDDFYNTDPGRSGSSNKRSSEGVLAPANWKGASKAPYDHGGRNGEMESAGLLGVPADGLGLGNESRVKKVKLKVGGITRTISTSNGGSESGSSGKNSRQSDSSRSRYKGSPDDIHSSDKRAGLHGIPWKDFSKAGFIFKKEDQLSGKMVGKNAPGKQEDNVETVRKSKRVSNKRVMDGDFDEDEDEELRYVEKLKNSKMHMGIRDDNEGLSKKERKLASVSDLSVAKPTKDVKKKSQIDKGFKDIEYEEEDETGSDREVEGKKKQKKEFVDTLMDNSRREMTLITRKRAMQSKNASASGASTIEFLNGLPPAPPRKQKEKLSEVEQQVKKAEAAQRRRIQNEKAAQESEAEAIRKILGQDSNRKKREDKMKKRLEELAEEKAANELMRASNCVRWVMGPNGTVVTFPNEMDLPAIFNPGPSRYPPPRENCAGPSCTNPYKYRDSKTMLPLCSLHCYKAVQERIHSELIC